MKGKSMRKLLTISAAAAAICISAPAMAVCPVGLNPDTFPSCEVGHIKFVMGDATSQCFSVMVLESKHVWSVRTTPDVPGSDDPADLLRESLLVYLANPNGGDLANPDTAATLIGSGAVVPECGAPNPRSIGQVR